MEGSSSMLSSRCMAMGLSHSRVTAWCSGASWNRQHWLPPCLAPASCPLTSRRQLPSPATSCGPRLPVSCSRQGHAGSSQRLHCSVQQSSRCCPELPWPQQLPTGTCLCLAGDRAGQVLVRAGMGTLWAQLSWMGKINIFRASFCGFGALGPKHREYISKSKSQRFYELVHLYVCLCVCTAYVLTQIYVYSPAPPPVLKVFAWWQGICKERFNRSVSQSCPVVCAVRLWERATS